MTDSPLVSVVVVAWNARHDLDVCLSSLHLQRHSRVEVIVVDNGSTDGTVDYLKSAYPWVRVHAVGRNIGYAAANNLGFQLAQGDYVVVLNPDTEVEPDFVSGLLETFTDDRVGLATSRVRLFDSRDRLNACGNDIHITGIGFCRGLDEPADRFESCDRVASISGSAFMIRKEVLERIGGFDEDYFIYVEDTDLSLRANLAGYRIMYAPRSTVYHKYALRMTAQKFFHLERNRRLTLLKNFRWSTLVALQPALWMTGALMWLYALLHGAEYLRSEVRARLWIYQHWGLILSKRERVESIRAVGDGEVLRLLSSTLPPDQVIGPGLFGRLAGFPVNLAYRLLALPVRVFSRKGDLPHQLDVSPLQPSDARVEPEHKQ